MELIKVKDEENLVRDKNTNAILNTDEQGLKAYKKQKEKMRKIDDIERDVAEIKNLLKELLGKQ